MTRLGISIAVNTASAFGFSGSGNNTTIPLDSIVSGLVRNFLFSIISAIGALQLSLVSTKISFLYRITIVHPHTRIFF